MSVFKRADMGDWWCYRRIVVLPDGRKVRIRGKAPINTKGSAEAEERRHVERVLNPKAAKGSTPTLAEWFDGRFWKEWVIGEGNRAGTRSEKRSIFDHQIKPTLGHLRLEDIDVAAIQRFKGELMTRPGRKEGSTLSPKTRANVLAVLSKALRYAEEVGVLALAPRIKLGKYERPEIIAWEFEEYARLVAAAAREGREWKVATLLAGDGGLRVGEVLALAWEDLDLVAGTMTIARSIYQGQEGPTKGGRARKVPMTSALQEALTALPMIRRGRVVRDPGGADISEGIVKGHRAYRICRLAGLPERSWHTLRHTFATHGAQLGVNPWRLQAWLGHASITMTMRYVHHAELHRRPTPAEVLAAGASVADPDARVLAMLGARTTQALVARATAAG